MVAIPVYAVTITPANSANIRPKQTNSLPRIVRSRNHFIRYSPLILRPMLFHQLFKLLPQLVEVVSGSLRLFRAGYVLRARLFDVLHGQRSEEHTSELQSQ